MLESSNEGLLSDVSSLLGVAHDEERGSANGAIVLTPQVVEAVIRHVHATRTRRGCGGRLDGW
jgi:hypothetical protein